MGVGLRMLSCGQIACLFLYIFTAIFLSVSEFLKWINRRPDASSKKELSLAADIKRKDGGAQIGNAKVVDSEHQISSFSITMIAEANVGNQLVQRRVEESSITTDTAPQQQSAFAKEANSCRQESFTSHCYKLIQKSCASIEAANPNLRAMFEFGSIMMCYYLCDRTDTIGIAGAHYRYSRDLFVFLFMAVTVAGLVSSVQAIKQPTFLSRQQTEEWKGWMQILFVMYHYFHAGEVYKIVRILVAGYVWMTGFGNFIYYHKTSDFSIGRFLQMLWRLNFLIFFTCIVMNSHLVLYYICPMHTLFTILVYAALGFGYQLNHYKAWLILKFIACWSLVVLLWRKPVFFAMWKHLEWLVGYQIPGTPPAHPLNEWYYRSGLDRYIWIYGMVCGMLQPYAQKFLDFLDRLSWMLQYTIKAIILAACAAAGYAWYTRVYTLPTGQYMAMHTYTTWIPITLYFIVRNISPALRERHIKMFAWLGCISLETYITQFHVWLRTGKPDHQANYLLRLVPGYPLINLGVTTIGYVIISYRLFEVTNVLKNAFVPHDNNWQLLRNVIMMSAVGAALYALANTCKTVQFY